MRRKDWSVHIVGSDLLPSAIKTAERGLYPQSSLAGLPPAIIRACFSKIGPSNVSTALQESANADQSMVLEMARQYQQFERGASAGQATSAQPGHV